MRFWPIIVTLWPLKRKNKIRIQTKMAMAGQKWTPEEEAALLQHLTNNVSMEEIAGLLGRTIKGVQLRTEDLAYKMHLAKVPMREIMRRTKLTSDQLTEAFQRIQTRPLSKSKQWLALREEVAAMHKEMHQWMQHCRPPNPTTKKRTKKVEKIAATKRTRKTEIPKGRIRAQT